MKLSKTYNLKAVNPGLAAQWHPVKNGDLTPEDVTPYSNKKVWWLCAMGHEWQAEVYVRNNGFGCPYCSGRRVNKENCLKTKNPSLARQWHPVKNGSLMPEDITSRSGKKVWWVCAKGHEWQEVVASRTRGTGCPYCSGKRVNKENSLKTKNPSLARQWHPVKNGDLSPEDITPGSGKKAWWKCEKGHEWQAVVKGRNSSHGCPYCSGKRSSKDTSLKAKNPLLASQWHQVKNGDLKPEDVLPLSNKKVWWKCAKGHEWQTVVFNRTRGNGCPYCAGKRVNKDNCLKTRNPSLAMQWHPFKNGDLIPEDVVPGSKKKVWWICEKGHEWQAKISDRTRSNTGCPYCSQKSAEYELTLSNPELAEMWHPEKNGNLTPADVTANSVKTVWWLCEKGHEWKKKVYLQDRKQGCPFCFKENPVKKVGDKYVSPAFRGFYKPRVQCKGSNSSPIKLITTIEDNIIIKIRGKIIERKKTISYARYVYGLDRIPEGWVIWHIDGDPLNNKIENLECISRSELLRRNSMNKGNKNP
jgi:DNA-directed RNA polymerase subunit RPC12/RpoP